VCLADHGRTLFNEKEGDNPARQGNTDIVNNLAGEQPGTFYRFTGLLGLGGQRQQQKNAAAKPVSSSSHLSAKGS
jgi:hypothetical protein